MTRVDDSLLIRGARLVDLDGSGTGAEVDVLVRAGRVVAVGRVDPGGFAGEVHEADGAWLMPGLWDAHVHLGQWSAGRTRLDLSGVGSVAEAVALVADRLAEHPGRPVIGWGHRPATWDTTPTRADLDALGTGQPVVLVAGDGHHGWMNTRALAALELPLDVDLVSEAEWFEAYARLDAMTDEGGPGDYRASMAAAAAIGVVGVTDFEFSGGVEDWLHRWREGADLLRVRMATYAEGLDDVLARGLRTGDPLAGDPRLVMGPLKVISDGSLNTGTAWCCEPYADGHGTTPHGEPNQSDAELSDLLARATAGGLEVAVHAIGDRAVTAAVDAVESTGARGSLEHVQLSRTADLDRMAALGLVASVQPAHLLDDRDLSEQVWPDRGDRCFALRSMRDAGVRLALGSDAPVSPLDPWLAAAAAVHRAPGDGDPWHPEQALTAREALAASTDGWGTVALGHPADLVLLAEDPLAPSRSTTEAAARLRRAGSDVLTTWVAGRLVHLGRAGDRGSDEGRGTAS